MLTTAPNNTYNVADCAITDRAIAESAVSDDRPTTRISHSRRCSTTTLRHITNRRHRLTDGLSLSQVENVASAARFAGRIGLPLNRHVTIRLESAGIADVDCTRAIGRFLTLFRDWLRKQGLPTAYVWVRERGPLIGSHVHILLHLPARVSLRGGRSRRWIENATGKKYVPGTICTRRIAPAAYDQNLAVLIGYLLKGAMPEVANALSLGRRKRGGLISGKRAGWSQNIGSAARARMRLTVC